MDAKGKTLAPDPLSYKVTIVLFIELYTSVGRIFLLVPSREPVQKTPPSLKKRKKGAGSSW